MNRLLMWCAIGWSVLLVAASFALPVVTVLSGRDGPQPRISLVDASGLPAALPAVGVVVGVSLIAGLLRVGGSTAFVVVRACTILICVGALAATVLFHIVGALTLPLAGALLVVAFTTETHTVQGSQRSA
jgi:hypothetical protein